jgi:uncharacterized protein YndB with AHSA1/START domain
VTYQPDTGTIRWKLRFRSAPEVVYKALSSPAERKRYWAESAEESNGVIHYVFLNGIEDRGEILESRPSTKFVVRYFGMRVEFALTPDSQGGTDLSLTATDVDEGERMEISAGWVSWLMAMKAAVDFGVDLRNHDSTRTWFQGYADS